MIYILGGNGFVGSGYVRLFQRLGLEHTIITRDNYRELEGSACDVFINANGNSSKILARREPMTDFEANVRVTRSTLEDFKYGFYIHLSSCDVYEDCSSPELTAEDRVIDFHRQSPYGFHKLLAEYCVRHRAENWLILRQGGFVGPGMKKNPIFDILYGDKLWLDPASELQFIHTDDSAAIVWNLYQQGLRNEIYNVCGDGVIQLSQVLKQAGRAVNIEPGSPAVHYEVNVAKLHKVSSISETKATIQAFMGNES